MTEAQLLATNTSLLQTGTGITAARHRQMNTNIIDFIKQQDYGFYNAEAYGGIQEAINAAELNPNGGMVYIGAKTWQVTQTLRIKKRNVGIIGCGEASKILAMGNYGHIIAAYPDVDPVTEVAFPGIRFKDFWVDSAVNRTSGCAIYTKWTHNCIVADVRIGTQQWDKVTPMFIYDGISFDMQDSSCLTGTQVHARHYGAYYSSTSIGGGSNAYDGLITGNCNFFGDSNNSQFVPGSAGVVLAGGADIAHSIGGFQIEQTNISLCQNGILVSGHIRELFIGHAFSADNCSAAGIIMTSGKIGLIQITGGWAAACGFGPHTPKYGIYIGDAVVGNFYGTPAILRINITGGTFYGSTGGGIYVGVGNVTFAGIHCYSNSVSGITLGANVTAASIVGGEVQSLINNSAITPKIRGVIGLADQG